MVMVMKTMIDGEFLHFQYNTHAMNEAQKKYLDDTDTYDCMLSDVIEADRKMFR